MQMKTGHVKQDVITFNICGKYGVQVQNLLKKAAGLDIEIICPLHGPILKENLGYYIGLYDTWSKYEPER